MTELIDRLEAAEGGSRELDAEIFRAIGGTVKDVTEAGGHKHKRWIDADGVRWQSDATLFSLSLDAALQLVPAGCAWRVSQRLDNRKPDAVIQRRDGKGGFDVWEETEAATPALALCAACLRAWEAK